MTLCQHAAKAFRILCSKRNGNRCFQRCYSSDNLPSYDVGKTIYQELKGRDLLTFDSYTRNDVFSLLWIATEIKFLKPSTLASTRGKRLCLIWSDPVTKASLSSASQQLDASLCSIHEEQLQKSSENVGMLGRTLGETADIIFINAPSWNEYHVERFATGCTCPVIIISSQEYCPVLAYSEMFTLFEKYGFLRRLIISSISSGTNRVMLNTYFTLLPIIGMHLRYYSYGEVQLSSSWEKAMQLSAKNNTEVKQFENINDALYRSHCLSTCFNNSSTSSTAPEINIKNVKEMDLDWTVLQHDSFKGLSVTGDFLKATDHNLIFKAIENQSWIFKALVLAHATDYVPTSPPPKFEGID